MLLKPYGVDSIIRPAFFIGYEGIGFWLLSIGDRLYGEARLLQDATTKQQNFELLNAFLIIRILNAHFEELRVEYINLSSEDPRSDPQPKEVLENLDEQEIKIRLEIYVRRLIRDFQISHPILGQYQEEVGKAIIDSNSFNFKSTVILTAIKCRAILNPNDLIIDTGDPEKAILTENAKIGVPGLEITDLENPYIPENLLAKVFLYADTEHKGLKWETTQEIKNRSPKDEPEEEIGDNEKKV